MNALVRLPRPQKTLIQVMRDDLRFGAPGAHLEAPEVPQWVRELGTDMSSQCIEALNSHADDKQLEAFGQFIAECMGDIKADRLIEFRDLIRSLVLDYSTSQAQKMLDAEEWP